MKVLGWAAVSSKVQANEDKVSLDDQKRMIQEICDHNAWDLVETLVVPGFSRDYYTLDDVASAAEDKEVFAFRKLQEHIKHKNFDIFMFYDADRFGRKSSLVHEVIGRVTGSVKAQLYSLVDGRIDRESSDIYALVKGLQAESNVKKFVAQRKKGIEKRASQGLNISSVSPRFHEIVRDHETGKVLAIRVKPEFASLWDDLVDLLVNEHESYDTLEMRLFERGHVDEKGQPYKRRLMYYWLNNPAFWGHRALNYASSIKQATEGYRRWVWDESSEPPEGVKVYRNVLPPVLDEIRGEAVRAELLRRVLVVKGHAETKTTYRFSQIVYCDECGKRMAYIHKLNKNNRHYQYLRCNTYHHKYQRGVCSNKKHVPSTKVQKAVTDFLQMRLLGQDISVGAMADTTKPTENLKKDIERIEKQLDTLIQELSLSPEAARDYYRKKIETLSGQLQEHKKRLRKIEQDNAVEHGRAIRQHQSLERLRGLTLEKLWELPEHQINALLIEVLGDYRFIASNGEITHVTTQWQRK